MNILSKNALPLMFSGVLLISGCLYLTSVSRNYADAGLADLWWACGFGTIVCFGCWYYYHKTDKPVSIALLLFLALALRFICMAIYPILEDDFFRYLWDARMFVETGSPYELAPAEFFGDDELPEKFENILSYINYPDVATVYGPVTQLSFALAYMLIPGEVWVLQLLYGLLDFAIVLMLTRLAPAKYVILYALNPLVLKEFSITAHPDVLGIFFIVAALLSQRREYYLFTAVLLALAVGSKIFAIIIAPLLLGFRVKSWLVFAGSLVAITLPFLPSNPWASGGLGAMTESWLFNSPLHLLAVYIADHFVADEFWRVWLPVSTKIVMLLLFSAIWCLYAYRYVVSRTVSIPRGDWLYGLFFLCVPVLNPWYLIWLLPFAVIYPSRWAWTASIAILLAYASGINLSNSELGAYQQPAIYIALEYSIVFIALCWDWRGQNNRYLRSSFSLKRLSK